MHSLIVEGTASLTRKHRLSILVHGTNSWLIAWLLLIYHLFNLHDIILDGGCIAKWVSSCDNMLSHCQIKVLSWLFTVSLMGTVSTR